MNDTRNKILVSARNLFEEYGYKKVSMDEIAGNAGVTKKTVYSYFKDKESLLNILIENEFFQMREIIEKYSNDNSLSFFEILNKSIYSLLSYKKESKLLVRLSREVHSLSSIKIIDNSIMDFIKEKLILLRNKEDVKNISIDIDLCSFVIYKVYVAIMFEYDKQINECELTSVVTQILKDGLFNKEGF